MDYPRIIEAGDSAIVVEFGNEISPEINGEVKAFTDAIVNAKISGVVDLIPTFRSCLVQYNPLLIRYNGMVDAINKVLKLASNTRTGTKRVFQIPVCYGNEYGPDLNDVAEHAQMTQQEIIDIHSTPAYLIYMLGFLPGFAYLGGMDERIAMPRLPEPRTKIPAGSVGIAGEQTGVYPLESPAGWRLIGRTPIKPYDVQRKEPILYEAGDYIKFVPIDKAEYLRIEAEVNAGTYVCKVVEQKS